MTKTEIRYKFVLRKLAAFKKFEEIFLPSFNCFTYSQAKYLEKRMIEDRVIEKVKEGGKWNEEGKYFSKNIYRVNWQEWELQYRGYLAAVEYRDLEKEFNEKVITSTSNAKLANSSDFKISSAVNRCVKGLSLSDIEKVLEKRYWQHRMILDIENEVKDSMIVENRAKFKFSLKGSKLERISYRPTNSYVSLKKSDGSRDRFLESHGLFKLQNGDIKSEIPRVNCLIEKGEWKDVDFDFYAEFCGDARARGEVKKWFMPMYMTHFKDGMARAHRTASQFIHEKKIEREDLKHQAFLFFEKISNKMEELMGEIHHSEIFIHTGAIEHLALLIAAKMYPNAKFFQIYDEIFATEKIENMAEIYRGAAEMYLMVLNFTEEEEEELDHDRLSIDSNVLNDDCSSRDSIEVDNKVVSLSSLFPSLVSKIAGSNSSSSSVKFEEDLTATLYRILHHVFDYEDVELKFKDTVSAKNGRH